jgi:HEAT repeat protein
MRAIFFFGALPLALLLGTGCQSDRDKLLAQVQSPHPFERALAVKKLSEQAQPEDLILFTQRAKDPVGVVRAEAIEALGKSQDPRIVDILGEMLGDSEEHVQAKAAMALAQVKSDKAKAYLTLQYGRRGQATREAIVAALKAANVPGAMASAVAAEANSIWERNLHALKEGSLPERAGAAEELGKSGRPEAVNRLVPLIKDNQIVLAAAAVRGLGNAQDKRAVGPIADLLKENFPELREAACEALGQLRDSSALPWLLEVATEKSPTSLLATTAIITLPQTAETDKALCDVMVLGAGPEAVAAGQAMRSRKGCPVDPILEKLKNTSTVPVALQALAALGPAAKDAAPKVLPLVSGTDANVRRLAVMALTEMETEAAAPAVLKAWDTEMKTLEPMRADWVATRLPEKYQEGFEPMQNLPDDGKPPVVRLRQQDLLRRVDALNEAKFRESGKRPLDQRPPVDLIDDVSNDQVRMLGALLRALGKLKVEGAEAKIVPYLAEDNIALRSAAYEAMVFLGGEALTRARQGLVDSERTVQSATAAAFAQSGENGQRILLQAAGVASDRVRLLEPLRDVNLGPQLAEAVMKLLADGGVETAITAVLLGRMKTKEAVDPLLKVLADPAAVARREVLLALGSLNDPKAVPALTAHLYHDSADVRAAAAQALGAFPKAAPRDALDALKGDYYRKVRETASDTLLRLGPEANR